MKESEHPVRHSWINRQQVLSIVTVAAVLALILVFVNRHWAHQEEYAQMVSLAVSESHSGASRNVALQIVRAEVEDPARFVAQQLETPPHWRELWREVKSRFTSYGAHEILPPATALEFLARFYPNDPRTLECARQHPAEFPSRWILGSAGITVATAHQIAPQFRTLPQDIRDLWEAQTNQVNPESIGAEIRALALKRLPTNLAPSVRLLIQSHDHSVADPSYLLAPRISVAEHEWAVDRMLAESETRRGAGWLRPAEVVQFLTSCPTRTNAVGVAARRQLTETRPSALLGQSCAAVVLAEFGEDSPRCVESAVSLGCFGPPFFTEIIARNPALADQELKRLARTDSPGMRARVRRLRQACENAGINLPGGNQKAAAP